MKNGARPIKPDHRDYCYHRSFGSVEQTPVFPLTLNVDAGLTMPNQSSEDMEFSPSVPPIPEGCTDEGIADVSTDQSLILRNPYSIEEITHANQNGGSEIRPALQAGISLGWFKAYFNIQPIGSLDWFDAIRLAILIGETAGEKRAVIMLTPWFKSWETAAQAGIYLMPMPTPSEIQQAAQNPNSLPWHCWVVPAWESEIGQGTLNLPGKSWQGKIIGKDGWLGFERATINVIMTVSGTGAYTVSQSAPANIQTVDLPFFQYLVSIIKTIFGLQ